MQKIRKNLDAQCINILVSHCFAQHGDASESERPLSIGGSDWVSVEPLKDFDYVALGHLHRPQKIAADHIRYSGSLLKYSFSEIDHAKSAVLARWDEQKHFNYKLLPLPASRDLRILEGELDTLLADGSQKSEVERNHYYLVRLTDTHAILDVMTKLRSVYPNVLHLERPGLVSHVQANMGQEQLKRDTVDLFADFFQQVNSSSINDHQRELLQKVIVDAQQESNQ